MAGVTSLYHLRNKEEGMNKALERISSVRFETYAVDICWCIYCQQNDISDQGLEAAIRNAADAISPTKPLKVRLKRCTNSSQNA